MKALLLITRNRDVLAAVAFLPNLVRVVRADGIAEAQIQEMISPTGTYLLAYGPELAEGWEPGMPTPGVLLYPNDGHNSLNWAGVLSLGAVAIEVPRDLPVLCTQLGVSARRGVA